MLLRRQKGGIQTRAAGQLLCLQFCCRVLHTRTHTQGYYRRGDAHFALGKYKLALKDLRTVGVEAQWS